jgi:Zn-dependent M28 family amino/carboxypeptidase
MRKLLLLAAVALVAVLGPVQSAMAAPPSETLRKALSVGGLDKHLKELQKIADQNGGTRLSISPGYTASVDYVSRLLRKAGYQVTIQPFTFEFVGETAPTTFERVSPNPRPYTPGAEFAIMTYSGSGDVTAPIQPVDVIVPMDPAAPASTSNSGCDEADWAGFTAGNIALLQRGTCTFAVKFDNARAHGASAVVIFNEGQPGRQETLLGTLGPPRRDAPAIGTSYEVGRELVEMYRAGQNPVVRVFTQTVGEQRTSSNVIAEAKTGNPNEVVMAGAHLDSVFAGPGINDNGTGSANLLEIALIGAQRLGLTKKDTGNHCCRQRIRFAWWGAEEQGLIGSRYYTDTLTPAQREQIDVYLNYDMNGSPNFVRFVGDGSAMGPPGSDKVEQVYLDYFASQGLATDPTPFDNRSDYGSFTAYNIPAGFLFTGAEGVKTPAQAATYGGTAGIAYDPCYHQACDTYANPNRDVLLQMTCASAHALIVWATTTSTLDHGVGGPPAGAGAAQGRCGKGGGN